MIINVHAGHNAHAPGASGLLDEVREDRRVKDLVISKLRSLGHTVYDCTDDLGTTAKACRQNIVYNCNSHAVELDVSIHFNAGASDPNGNGKTTGVEVLVYKAGNAASGYASKICAAIADLGFRNRGVKARPDLYVLRHTKAPALLVECCFVDDADDARLYDADKMAAAIVQGITGQAVSAATTPQTATSTAGYRVRVTASTLNVRADHSAASKVVTTVRKGEVYTIVDQYNNGGTIWGKLKSGAGWIALRYTERV